MHVNLSDQRLFKIEMKVQKAFRVDWENLWQLTTQKHGIQVSKA